MGFLRQQREFFVETDHVHFFPSCSCRLVSEVVFDSATSGALYWVSASLQLASLMWREFYADRHSHWPGFSCAFEHLLVERAWQQAQSNPTSDHVSKLLVEVARAYGRIGAFRAGSSHWAEAFPQALALDVVASAWKSCASELESAQASLIARNVSPDMSALEEASQAMLLACQSALGGSL